MIEENETVPWICHVCGKKSVGRVGKACALCFKIACDTHLKPLPLKCEKLGNLELKMVCTACAKNLEGEEAEADG